MPWPPSSESLSTAHTQLSTPRHFFDHALAIMSTPASITSRMIAFLFPLPTSLLLLLYCFRLLSPILLQFFKLLTQPPAPSLSLTLISQLPSLVFTLPTPIPVICYLRPPLSFQLRYQLCPCFHHLRITVLLLSTFHSFAYAEHFSTCCPFQLGAHFVNHLINIHLFTFSY